MKRNVQRARPGRSAGLPIEQANVALKPATQGDHLDGAASDAGGYLAAKNAEIGADGQRLGKADSSGAATNVDEKRDGQRPLARLWSEV